MIFWLFWATIPFWNCLDTYVLVGSSFFLTFVSDYIIPSSGGMGIMNPFSVASDSAIVYVWIMSGFPCFMGFLLAMPHISSYSSILIHVNPYINPMFFSYGTVMRPWMKSDCAPLEGGDWKPLLHFRANSAVGDSKSLMAEIFGWKAMSGSSFLGIAMEKKGGSKLISMEGGERIGLLDP